MNITVIGLGYMGLPYSFLLAKAGHNVSGYDINLKKVEILNKGELPFEEKGLKELFEDVKKTGNFVATNKLENNDVYVIAVPTPEKNHRIDSDLVTNASESVSKVIKDGDLVIIESTISPNICKGVVKPILDKSGKKYGLVHCPERAIPGNTLHELVNNDRIIGGLTENDAVKAKEIYSSFVKGKIHLTDITTAEVVKLSENTFRDINIAYANELALICYEIGINPWEVIKLANLHPRVKILSPGPGVGGHCIAVDPWFLTEASNRGKIIRVAREINDHMPDFVVERLSILANKYKMCLNGSNILVLGLSYKADVDDDRESPSYLIISRLKEHLANVKVFDSHLLSKSDFNNIDSAFEWADVVVLSTNHKDFIENINVTQLDKVKFLFDTRNCLPSLIDINNYHVL